MIDDNFFWKYDKQPGKKLEKEKAKISIDVPLVSIITSYYNSNEDMNQTINCVLNQTFESWEWIIVDDGSTKKEAIEYLEEVKKIDERIKIYHKQNGGLALGRDYGIERARTNYILPLDADDLIEPTYIETLYWTLETNKDATWAFTDSVGFGKYIYLSDKKFDSETMKIDNMITATALIRKEKILELGGYGKAKRYVNEDWHLWLRMLAKEYYPIHVAYYGFWYRRREGSLLSEINDQKKQEYQQKMKDLKVEADKITKKVNAIEYPKKNINQSIEKTDFKISSTIKILNNTNDANLYVLPYLGTDKKMYKKIKEDSKDKKIYIITLQNNGKSQYFYRQKYEEFAIVYDLTSFSDEKNWLDFIQYILDTRKINNIYLSNTKYNKIIKENFSVKIIEECRYNNYIYNNQVLIYKINHLLPIRAIRKIVIIIANKISGNRKEE